MSWKAIRERDVSVVMILGIADLIKIPSLFSHLSCDDETYFFMTPLILSIKFIRN
jgi:hypothetical protein